jgi:hypothetical protein
MRKIKAFFAALLLSLVPAQAEEREKRQESPKPATEIDNEREVPRDGPCVQTGGREVPSVVINIAAAKSAYASS